jgi:hypothetical protein
MAKAAARHQDLPDGFRHYVIFVSVGQFPPSPEQFGQPLAPKERQHYAGGSAGLAGSLDCLSQRHLFHGWHPNRDETAAM